MHKSSLRNGQRRQPIEKRIKWKGFQNRNKRTNLKTITNDKHTLCSRSVNSSSEVDADDGLLILVSHETWTMFRIRRERHAVFREMCCTRSTCHFLERSFWVDKITLSGRRAKKTSQKMAALLCKIFEWETPKCIRSFKWSQGSYYRIWNITLQTILFF